MASEKSKGKSTMNLFRIGEVDDPHDLLRSPNDKLVGYIIRGTFQDDYLLCIRTDNTAPYYEDDGFRGTPGLLIYNPGAGEIYTSFGDSGDSIEQSLAYFRNHCGLNKWEINELLGHDGPSSSLVEHIAKLVADLPPAAENCRTESDANECTVSTARTIIRNIVARHGDGKSMHIRFACDGEVAGRTVTEKVLAELDKIDPAQRWLLDTGDGHVNPVSRIAPLRHRRTGKYVVGVWFDSMIEFGGDE